MRYPRKKPTGPPLTSAAPEPRNRPGGVSRPPLPPPHQPRPRTGANAPSNGDHRHNTRLEHALGSMLALVRVLQGRRSGREVAVGLGVYLLDDHRRALLWVVNLGHGVCVCVQCGVAGVPRSSLHLISSSTLPRYWPQALMTSSGPITVAYRPVHYRRAPQGTTNTHDPHIYSRPDRKRLTALLPAASRYCLAAGNSYRLTPSQPARAEGTPRQDTGMPQTRKAATPASTPPRRTASGPIP